MLEPPETGVKGPLTALAGVPLLRDGLERLRYEEVVKAFCEKTGANKTYG